MSSRRLQDRLQIGVLKNKWYIDEIYAAMLIRPSIWFAEHVVYQLIDKTLIDGFLNLFGRVTATVGSGLRNGFDKPIINTLFGDGTANVIRVTGRNMRTMQTGRIQQYMVASLFIMILVAGLAFYLLGRI